MSKSATFRAYVVSTSWAISALFSPAASSSLSFLWIAILLLQVPMLFTVIAWHGFFSSFFYIKFPLLLPFLFFPQTAPICEINPPKDSNLSQELNDKKLIDTAYTWFSQFGLRPLENSSTCIDIGRKITIVQKPEIHTQIFTNYKPITAETRQKDPLTNVRQ